MEYLIDSPVCSTVLILLITSNPITHVVVPFIFVPKLQNITISDEVEDKGTDKSSEILSTR